MVLNAVRIVGVVLVLLGILVVRDVLQLPHEAGYVLLVAGVFEIFVMPQILARKWRTPPTEPTSPPIE
jgi:membrane protein YdbS with pleckstrin-like domain